MKELPGAKETQAKLGLLGAMFLFGTIGIFVRYIPLPSSVIALVRGIVGTLFLLLVVLLRRTPISKTAVRRNLPRLCIAGALIGANWILLFEAYRYTTVATATLCYYLAPVFVMLLSPLVLKERLTAGKALCALIALLGMALVSGAAERGPSGAGEWTGILFGVGAAACYAVIVLLNKRLSGISAYDMTIVQLGVSAAVVLPYALLTENFAKMTVTPLTAGLLLTVGVLHTGVAYALYFGSMQHLRAQTVAVFSYVDPIVAILLSALLLKEPMRLTGGIGAVLVLGATLMSELLEHRRERPPAKTNVRKTAVRCRRLRPEEIDCALFSSFRRRQVVTRCLRKHDGAWWIVDDPFTDDWTETEYGALAESLRCTALSGGAVFGAFADGSLKGFASVEPGLFGGENAYMDLSNLHVSEELRGRGIGRALFLRAKVWARAHGAKKLYLSAHSALESQAFYRAMGCVEAAAYDEAHTRREPCDCQMECRL